MTSDDHTATGPTPSIRAALLRPAVGLPWQRVITALGLALAAGAVLILGGSLFLGSFGFAVDERSDPTAACPYGRGCTTMSVAEVTDATGYAFPEGSRVQWAVDESSWLDGSRTVRARVAMPAGSEIPKSSSSRAEITVMRNDSGGVEVEVSRVTSEGS